jgi:hypothetical protein
VRLQQVGERGRIVVLHPTPTIRRVLELTGVIGIIDINDDPSSPHRVDANGPSSLPVG